MHQGVYHTTHSDSLVTPLVIGDAGHFDIDSPDTHVYRNCEALID